MGRKVLNIMKKKNANSDSEMDDLDVSSGEEKVTKIKIRKSRSSKSDEMNGEMAIGETPEDSDDDPESSPENPNDTSGNEVVMLSSSDEEKGKIGNLKEKRKAMEMKLDDSEESRSPARNGFSKSENESNDDVKSKDETVSSDEEPLSRRRKKVTEKKDVNVRLRNIASDLTEEDMEHAVTYVKEASNRKNKKVGFYDENSGDEEGNRVESEEEFNESEEVEDEESANDQSEVSESDSTSKRRKRSGREKRSTQRHSDLKNKRSSRNNSNQDSEEEESDSDYGVSRKRKRKTVVKTKTKVNKKRKLMNTRPKTSAKYDEESEIEVSDDEAYEKRY